MNNIPRSYMYIFDLDGTLSVDSERKIFVTGSRRDYDKYHKNCKNDYPNEAILRIVNSLFNTGYAIGLVTGRPEKYRVLTEEWLERYGVNYTELIMRPDSDLNTASGIMKVSQINTLAKQYEIVLVFDDRDKVLGPVSENGYITAQIQLPKYNNRNTIYYPNTDACYICKRKTHFVEINFETYLCPGNCTDQLYDEYKKACVESKQTPGTTELDYVNKTGVSDMDK